MSEGFVQKKREGKKVEEIVKRHLESRGHTIEDKSEDPIYQNLDIDFIVKDSTGEETTLEVKEDNGIGYYGNFFFELGFERKTKYGEGWLKKCQAEYLCSYDCRNGTGYIIDYQKIKQVLFAIGERRKYWNQADQCYGDAILVPVGKAQEYIVHSWKN